jgi:hypothetical protein
VTNAADTAKKGANIALNAPVMITHPTALILAKGIQTLGVSALIAAFIVSVLVYGLDWAVGRAIGTAMTI